LDARVRLMTAQRDAVFIGEGARPAGGIAEPRGCLPGGVSHGRNRCIGGHLLIGKHGNGGMYAHRIAPASDDLGSGNLVLQTATS
jgi:hypothetical protein